MHAEISLVHTCVYMYGTVIYNIIRDQFCIVPACPCACLKTQRTSAWIKISSFRNSYIHVGSSLVSIGHENVAYFRVAFRSPYSSALGGVEFRRGSYTLNSLALLNSICCVSFGNAFLCVKHKTYPVTAALATAMIRL